MDRKIYERINIRSKGHEKILGDLSTYIEDLIEQRDDLREKLNNYSKEDEIKKLEGKLGFYMTNSIHIMTDKEKSDAKSFITEHYESCKSNIQYILEGTGIGTAISVRCKKCDTVKHITDHDNW
jgi:cupin superfamily acireductone dioxygenase involved in methionine salvage